jgi:hypothetical protein
MINLCYFKLSQPAKLRGWDHAVFSVFFLLEGTLSENCRKGYVDLEAHICFSKAYSSNSLALQECCVDDL